MPCLSQRESKQHLQSSRQNSQPSKPIDRSFLRFGSKPFHLKLFRCCSVSCLRRQLDVLQMGKVADDSPREFIVCNKLGVHGGFGKQPEQRDIRELVELVVPDLSQKSGS